MQVQKSGLARSKLFGTAAAVLGVFGFLVIAHRLSYYIYEYDDEFSPVDYGRFNILSFFTIQSNVFVYIYLIAAGLAAFGVKKAEKIAHEPLVGAMRPGGANRNREASRPREASRNRGRCRGEIRCG